MGKDLTIGVAGVESTLVVFRSVQRGFQNTDRGPTQNVYYTVVRNDLTYANGGEVGPKIARI
jgi:hypothetical protein